jgi:hypothetical protein
MMAPLFFFVTFPFFFIIIAILGSVTASSFFPFFGSYLSSSETSHQHGNSCSGN